MRRSVIWHCGSVRRAATGRHPRWEACLCLGPAAELLVDALQRVGGAQRLPLRHGVVQEVKRRSPASSKLVHAALQRSFHMRKDKSWRADSNRGPADYESTAGAYHRDRRCCASQEIEGLANDGT